MFVFSPVIASIRLVSSRPSAENILSAWVDVAGTHKYFLTKGTRLGYLDLLSLHQSRGSQSLSRSGSLFHLLLVLQFNHFLVTHLYGDGVVVNVETLCCLVWVVT
eukprot:GFUD01123270.1.p1 GENE.GFUD01123270.1~~GFUD01123270.1.p1  ORF type:complete len:105 (+),score=23.23 GFUD01123270.1:114-428(+)